MWTTDTEYYTNKAVFREEDWYVLPAISDKHYRTNLFHVCPEPDLHEDWPTKTGRVFSTSHAKDMWCNRCCQSPGDDIVTVYTLLREA